MRITPSHVVPARRFVSPSQNVHPILLYDAVTVQSGGEQEFRSQAFTNNFGVPVEIHSMRVLIQIAGAGAIPSTVLGGGLVALGVSIDKAPVTRGPIPVWDMCRSDNRRNDSFGNSITDYCWYFAHPAPLLPGKTLTVNAKHLGVISQAATVHVSFAGRVSKSSIPRRIPFAAAWSSRAFTFAEAATDAMPPAALMNDTGRELHVSRIIGRSIAFDDGSGVTQELRDYDDVSLQGVSSFLVRLGLSQSRPILKTYTQWRAVFGQTAAIETDFILKPGDYLTGDVQHVAGPVLTTPFLYSQNRGELAIVGWREV